MRRPPPAHRSPSTPPPLRLLEGGGNPHLARVLAAAARPVQAPRALRERVLAKPLAGRGGGAWRAAFAVVALGAGAAAVLTVRSGGWGRSGPTTLAEVVAVSGAGQLARGDTAPIPLTAGARIGDGETVWSRGEPLSLALPSLKVKLAAGSGASFRGRAAGGLDIGLVRGEIALDVDRRAPDQPLVVTAGDYEVRVVGTIFTVRAPATGGPIEVSVAEGLVHVRGPATDRQLRAGDCWSSATQATTEAAAAPAGTAAGAGAAGEADATTLPASGEVARERRTSARALALGSAGPGQRGPGKPPRDDRLLQARQRVEAITAAAGASEATTPAMQVPSARAASAPADPPAAITGCRGHARPGAGNPRSGRCSHRSDRVAFPRNRNGRCPGPRFISRRRARRGRGPAAAFAVAFAAAFGGGGGAGPPPGCAGAGGGGAVRGGGGCAGAAGGGRWETRGAGAVRLGGAAAAAPARPGAGGRGVRRAPPPLPARVPAARRGPVAGRGPARRRAARPRGPADSSTSWPPTRTASGGTRSG